MAKHPFGTGRFEMSQEPMRRVARTGRCPNCGDVKLTKELSRDPGFVLSHRFHRPKEIFECMNCGEWLIPCRLCNKTLIPLKINPHAGFLTPPPKLLARYKSEEGRCIYCIGKHE